MARKNFDTLLRQLSPEARTRVEDGAKDIVTEMALSELRSSLSLTQEEVARLLKINQGSLSKMENQIDMYVSTLRKLVSALGGELELVARFPDRAVILNQFEKE